jgi:voltage-gated potassium channel
MLIEGWNLLNALYMVVITMTTVGYREVEPLSNAGLVFTMLLSLAGVGTLFYVATSSIQMAVEGEIFQALGFRRMQSRIEQLRDHYLLCGFGRVGSEVARVFAARKIPFVVIESDSERLGVAGDLGYLVVEGDATDDASLQKAGIRRARGLVAASDSDAGNTFITLSARALNPDLFIIARAASSASEPRIAQAGADRVISPYVLAGRRMALTALQPSMLDFVDTTPADTTTTETILVEPSVVAESRFIGGTLGEMFATARGTRVLGIHKRDGQLIVGPPHDAPLQEGDRIIAMGPEAELEGLNGAWLQRRHAPTQSRIPEGTGRVDG